MPNSAVYGWGDLIGNTPLLKLDTLSQTYGLNLFAKLEMFNLGGSMKDRPAKHMIQMALRDGLITTATTIVESSSGNMGIGLAQVCLRYGLRFVCVVDATVGFSLLLRIHLSIKQSDFRR